MNGLINMAQQAEPMPAQPATAQQGTAEPATQGNGPMETAKLMVLELLYGDNRVGAFAAKLQELAEHDPLSGIALTAAKVARTLDNTASQAGKRIPQQVAAGVLPFIVSELVRMAELVGVAKASPQLARQALAMAADAYAQDRLGEKLGGAPQAQGEPGQNPGAEQTEQAQGVMA